MGQAIVMSQKASQSASSEQGEHLSKEAYKDTLHKLQVELVKLQRHLIKCNHKILILFEGRDASGIDGTIKRIVQHLNPRDTRVVALGKPSNRDRTSYFQLYAPYLPAAQELFCLTTVGITALASSGSWVSAPRMVMHNLIAPWTLIRANDKHLARLQIIKRYAWAIDTEV